jgi:serine/threonine-protein kinase
MGRIYKAHDPDIRRTVAIKLISTELMGSADRADYIRRFRREAEAAARCAHPNIITIYDFALHEGQPFLAMEFVNGLSLRQTLNETRVMAVPDAIWIMLQVLDALASAHAQGVIHQDIKPANIMLTSEKRVKVGDFGISRLVNTDVTTMVDTIGTPAYMSPEQCRGEEVDRRSDLFSAGATLFEMVAGERAFPGRNITEVSHRVQNEKLALLPAEVRAAAPRLQLMLERAMGKHPEDRFDTAADMARALRQVLAAGPGEETPESTRLQGSAGVARGPSSSTSPEPDPLSRPPTTSLDPDLLRLVEDKLKVYVGPIARILVRAAAERSSSAAELCSQLALAVRDDTERERFRRDVESLTRHRPLAPPRTSSLGDSRSEHLPEQELERAQAALTQFVGPIARIFVRRAAANVSTVEALWQVLASHIDSPAERTAFLRQRQK